MITVYVEPDKKTMEFRQLNTVMQLLNRLHLRPTQALVVRDGALLTQDIKFHQGDEIIVKKVTSVG